MSGCRLHCRGCFNADAQDFNYGHVYTDAVEESILVQLEKPWISGLTILGGEPLEPENQCVLAGLVARVREKFPRKTIWLYSGYTFEKMPRTAFTDVIIDNIDVVVDGPFVEELKDLSLQFRGSSNQRILETRLFK